MRPQSLAAVADLAIENPLSFALACDEFCDAFYVDYPDIRAMQAHLDPVPKETGNSRCDAWIGAIGEHLARRWGLKVPEWTFRPQHYALEHPDFVPPSLALRGALMAESPPAFRTRLIFTMAEPLLRARFPSDAARVLMPWDED